MARPQVNTDLGGAERVAPIASPQGISAPVSTVQETGAMRLASSLASLHPALNEFIQGQTDNYREDEANRAYDTIQGMTYEQAKAAVESGEMRKSESPWFRAAFQKQFGMATAQERRREIITAYNNEFDKENGDVNQFLAGYAQKDFEAFQGSEFIMSGLREGMAGVFDQVRNTHAEWQDTQLQTRAAEQFYTIARDTVSSAAESGADVNAAITSIVSQHTAAGLIDQDRADAALMGLAEEFSMSGDLASLNAVLNADPHGRGSFASRAGFSTKAQTLIEQAQATAGDKARIASIDPKVEMEARARGGLLDAKDDEQITAWVENKVMSVAEAENLKLSNMTAQAVRLNETTEANLKSSMLKTATEMVLSQNGASVTDTTIKLPDGSEKKISGKELRQTVLNEQMTVLLKPDAPDGPVNVARAAQHMASWALPETFEPWENSLTNGYRSLTGALTKPDKEGKVTLPKAATDAYMLYREMSGADKVREMHIKDTTAAAVYRDAETLEEIGGYTPEEALIASASIDRNSTRTSLSGRIDSDTFDKALSGYMSGGLWGTDPTNAQIVKSAVEEHARILMDMNIPQDKAIKRAIDRFDSSYTLVNGVYINTRDRYVPSQIEEISAGYVEDFLKTNPQYDEAYFTPDRNQEYWTFTDQFGGTLSNAPKIHISELPQYLAEKTRRDTNEAIQENQ